MNDEKHMRECLELALRAEGRTAPNPMVGSLVVNPAGIVIGRGLHRKAGEPHAEVFALNEAGDQARGATLYVNLEPCCHYGRTPPCLEKIIAAGIRRVVAGMIDPNPAVAGGGIAALADAGIETSVGVLEDECRWLNRAFIKHKSEGRPWVSLKLATTLDGRIADRTGGSRWITGADARRHVHRLRNTHDCVLVGGATALKDNPSLSVRDIQGGRHPLRAVLDTSLRLAADANVCRQELGGPTVIFCSPAAFEERGHAYPEGVSIVPLPVDESGRLDLLRVFAWLGEQDILTVLCEGGGRLAGALMAAGLADEVHWLISAKIMGDAQAVPALASGKEVLLADAWQLTRTTVDRLGEDVLVWGIPKRS